MSQSFPRNRDEWLEPPDDDEPPRECEMCDDGMWEGYLIEDSTYCSRNCVDKAISLFTDKSYEELHEEEPDLYFWTEWEEGE